MKNPLACLVLLVLAVAGCGYTTGSLLPGQFKTICVLPFKNEVSQTQNRSITYIPLLEVKAREAVVDRFLFNGRLRVADEQVADLVMKGVLKGFERHELRVSDEENVQEYRINVIVDLSLWDTVEQKTVWSEPNFAGEATYFVTGPQAKSESVAIQEALTDLARRAVERTVEDW